MAILVVLSVVVAIGVILAVANLRHNSIVGQEVRDLLAASEDQGGRVVTEKMLRDLPEPVQRYLSYTGVVGGPVVQTVRLPQTGRIRQGPDQPWMEYAARQYYSVAPPAFVWDATARMMGLPGARVRDKYAHGSGHMLVKMGALFPIVTKGARRRTRAR